MTVIKQMSCYKENGLTVDAILREVRQELSLLVIVS